jgi:FkbM family methyltransferase
VSERQPQTGVVALGRLLRHYDPRQLLFQLDEIVGQRTYLRHGIRVEEGDVVLDVGGNVGVAAAFFASDCRAGLVHSFEPVAPLFDLLRENLRHFPACVAHNYGLSSSAGRASITYYPNAAAMSGLYADPVEDRRCVRTILINTGISEQDADQRLDGRYETKTLSCEMRTLSAVISEESLTQVDLLKLDVEKAEFDVLKGVDEGDWPRIKQVVAEVHDQHGRRAAISEMLTTRGFSVATEQDAMWKGTDVHMLYATRR